MLYPSLQVGPRSILLSYNGRFTTLLRSESHPRGFVHLSGTAERWLEDVVLITRSVVDVWVGAVIVAVVDRVPRSESDRLRMR
jgi:hypothetical protein